MPDIHRVDWNQCGSWRRGIEFDSARICDVQRAVGDLVDLVPGLKARITVNNTPVFYCAREQGQAQWKARTFPRSTDTAAGDPSCSRTP